MTGAGGARTGPSRVSLWVGGGLVAWLPPAALAVACAAAVLGVAATAGGADGAGLFSAASATLAALGDDAALGAALWRQTVFLLGALAIQLPGGIALALLMPRGGRGAMAVAMLVALPLLLPAPVAGVAWRVLQDAAGDWLAALPSAGALTAWAGGRATTAWLTLLLADAWQRMPLVALICHAALVAVPATTRLAAHVEGAGAVARFTVLTWPALRAVLPIATMLCAFGSLAVHALPWMLTGGGPGGATTLLSQHLHERVAAGGPPLASAWPAMLLWLATLAVCGFAYRPLRPRPAVDEPPDPLSDGFAGRGVRGWRAALLASWCLFAIAPLAALVAVSVLPPDGSDGAGWTLDTYRTVLASRDWLAGFGVAAVVAITTTVATLAWLAPVARIGALRDLPAAAALFLPLLAAALMPAAAWLPAWLQLASPLGRFALPPLLLLAALVAALPVAAWLVRAAVVAVPRQLEEQARLAGRDRWPGAGALGGADALRGALTAAGALAFLAGWSGWQLAAAVPDALRPDFVVPIGTRLVAAVAPPASMLPASMLPVAGGSGAGAAVVATGVAATRVVGAEAAAAAVLAALPVLVVLMLVRRFLAAALTFGRIGLPSPFPGAGRIS